jgi:hypothetical protein
LLKLLDKRNIARTIIEQEARMGNGSRAAHAALVAAMLAAPPAFAQASPYADSYAHLHGYGEGVAAVLAASAHARRQQVSLTDNGKILLKTYRQPGIALTTWSADGKTYPMSLAISRPGYPLPLGLHIGDLRGAVERTLGAPGAGGDVVVVKRTQGDGCADPIALTFRGKLLAQVEWTWERCTD